MLDGSLNDFSEFLKFRFILFDTQRDKWKEVFHMLVHSPVA